MRHAPDAQSIMAWLRLAEGHEHEAIYEQIAVGIWQRIDALDELRCAIIDQHEQLVGLLCDTEQMIDFARDAVTEGDAISGDEAVLMQPGFRRIHDANMA